MRDRHFGRTTAVAAGVAVASSVIFITLLYVIFDPVWDTNDDVAMSMVAHGYGLAAYGSPALIFSNVLWGVIVRSIPTFGGVLGYSVATIACLGLTGAAIIFFLRQIGLPLMIGGLAAAAVLLRAILIPQFTMTAGLLAVAAILGVVAYDRKAWSPHLIAAVCLALVGTLMRDLEVALVCLVALPLLPWRLIADRRAQVATLAALACLAIAALVNHLAYQGPEWRYFTELNLPRALFTDFGAGVRLLENPDVMAKYGWSRNDVDLISSYFFVDGTLADPAVMKNVISDIGFTPTVLFSFGNGLISLRSVADATLLPLALTGFALLVLALRPGLCIAWAICLTLMYMTGGFGRLGVSRIYLPLFALLVAAPLCHSALHAGWRKWAAGGVMAAGLLLNAWLLSANLHVAGSTVRPLLASPHSTVVWGASFPYETAYPLFTRGSETRDTRLFPLGVFTFAPFSVASADEAAGQGMIARLRSPEGIAIIAAPYLLKYLGTYCEERLRAKLVLEDAKGAFEWAPRVAHCGSAEKTE